MAYSAKREKWRLHLDRMEKLNLPADLEQLLTWQIDGLKDEDRELLELIACYGGRIGPAELRLLTRREEGLPEQLDRLCGLSLLVRTPPDSYSLVHDIVLKLVYNNLTGQARSEIHYRIAEALEEQKSGSLAIASHLLAVPPPLLLQGGAERWTGLLYRAGAEAKHGAAAERALEIFGRCAELLSLGGTHAESGLSFDVRLELADCRYICGQAEEAKRDFETLLAQYPDREKQLRIKRKYINLSAFNGDFERVLDLGFQILSHLNFRLVPKDIIPDLIKSRLLYGNRKIDGLEDAPVITGEKLLCILETLTIMLPSANRINDRMSAMIALKLAILSARYGNSDYAPVAYASYCYVLFNILRDHSRGKRLEDVSFSLIDQCENAASKYVTLCILGSSTHHWTHPLKETVACLERSVLEGEKEDSSLYSSYAAAFAILTKYMAGVSVYEMKEYIKDFRKKEKRFKHYLSLRIYGIYESHIRWLEEGVFPEEEVSSGEYEYKKLFANTIRLNGDIIALQRLYIEGKTQEAYRLAEACEPEVSLHKSFIPNIEYFFYSILVRLAVHQDLSGAEKRRNKKRIVKDLKELKYWVRVYKGNHYARYLLAQAEYDARFAPEKAVGKLYREAMEFAEEQGNLPLEALANLLAAGYHRDDRKLSSFYAAEAVRLYREWGAPYISGLINHRMGLAPEAAAIREEPRIAPAAKKAEPDILGHLNRMEAMGEDEGYLYLLDLLTGQDQVDYCAVLFEKSGEMHLQYEQRKGGQAQVHPEPINMNHLSGLPHRIIRYGARTETEILLAPGSSYGIFANEPYLMDREKISLACLPLKYQGVCIGMIYLEKERDDFGLRLPDLVKGFLPSLLAKKTSIREVQTILNPPSESTLSERELEVLKLVAQGMSNSEISKTLYITLGTVRNHLSNIYAKLEVDNRIKAVMKAKELRIIQL